MKAAFSSTGSGSPLGTKTPASATTPPKVAVKASPATSPSVTPTKQLGMATQKVVMQSPSQSAKPKAQAIASPVKPVIQKQSPAASPVPAVASSVTSTGTSVTQTSTATASTAVSGIKTVVQGQLVNQGQAASAGSITGQGLALIRAPVQLPPGVQATMITNAQGIPVMRLQGAGIQGTAPVTIVTTQVGATQLQGATIVRMAAPVGNPASSGTTTGTVLRLPVQSGTSNVPGTAVLKIPVTTSIQLPGATGLTMTAIAGSSGQAVIRQQLPVTLPANLPPGTQLKVGPQGQLTAVGPGGIPVQLTLQNVKTQQVATGLQVQSGATIGTPTVVQLAGASPVKANIAQLTTSSAAPAKVTQATQSLVTSTKPAVTLTVASVAKTVMTTASVTPSSAVVSGQTTLVKKQIPATAPVILGQEQKTSATPVSTSGQPVKTTMSSKQTTVVTTLTTRQQFTKTMVTGTISTSGAVSVTTVLPSKVNPPATSTAKAPVPQETTTPVSIAKASLPTTIIASIPAVVKTNTADSTTTSKTTTSSTTTLSTQATPKAVVSVAKATAAESTMQSSVTQMSRSAVAPASTAGIVKAVTTAPVVSSVTTPLVSSTVSSNTPVAVVSPLITKTRPTVAVTRASTGNVSNSLPQTVTTSSAQVTTAMSRTVNDGAGVKADRSATPALISKVKFNF